MELRSYTNSLLMLSTGLFKIVSAQSTANQLKEPTRVEALTAECLTCNSTISAGLGNGLESLPGGVVLTCSKCGARQAVSSSLFNAVIQQTKA
jgi:hypothetical protein